jgi:hypothetical protein
MTAFGLDIKKAEIESANQMVELTGSQVEVLEERKGEQSPIQFGRLRRHGLLGTMGSQQSHNPVLRTNSVANSQSVLGQSQTVTVDDRRQPFSAKTPFQSTATGKSQTILEDSGEEEDPPKCGLNYWCSGPNRAAQSSHFLSQNPMPRARWVNSSTFTVFWKTMIVSCLILLPGLICHFIYPVKFAGMHTYDNKF